MIRMPEFSSNDHADLFVRARRLLAAQAAPGALVVLHPKGTLDARAFPHSYYGSEGTSETYSFHNGGANIAFGDGRVQFMAEAIGIRDFARLVTRDGSEVTSGEVQ